MSNISLFALGSVSTAASFEGDDGDLTHDSLTDWNDFASLAYTGDAPYQTATKNVAPWQVYAVTDARGSIDGGNDSTYAGGVKQADECPAIIATGKNASTQNKDDIARIYVAGKLDPSSGHVFLALAWVRVPQNTTSSDLHIGFEFNQSQTACGGSSDSLVDRTTGDILIVYNFQSGSASLAYSTWDDTTKSWSAETTLPPAISNAAVFGGSGSTSDLLKPTGAPNPETNEFGEAILDLTQAQIDFGGNSGRTCERFGRVFGESRSSGSSTTAQMEDLVGPTNIDLSNCASPSITTSASPSTATLGQAANVKDTATVTGANAPTGNVTFQLYTDSDCSTAVTPAVTGSSGFTATGTAGTYTANDMSAVSWTPTTAGTYYWKASYAGDGNNNSTGTCGGDGETITVPKAGPSITTSATPSTATVGTGVNVKDTATLNSAFSPTGTVSFQLYSNSTCTTTVAGISGSSAIAGTGPYTANNMTAVSWTPTAAGTYYWGASYAGDGNNNSVSSCGGTNETIVVSKTTPSITTTLKNAAGDTTIGEGSSIGLGSSVYDTSTLGNLNGVAATGTITYQYFTNGTCSNTPSHEDAGVAVGGSSTTQGPLGAGSYSFRAKYVAGSDAAHTDSDWSSCEPFTVAKATPTAATTLKNAADDSTVTNGSSLALNSSLYDTAQITGVSGVTLSGTVTFQFFTNSTCTGSPLSTESGVAPGTNSATKGPLGAGDYGFRAKYVAGSDPNYNDSSFSSCEPFSIGKGTPSSATTLKNAVGDATVADGTTLAINSSVYDTAQITAGDGLALTGTVTFDFFTNGTCSGTPENTQTGVAVGAQSDATGALGAGDYGFRAMYVAGNDSNHNDSAWSACEPFSIAKASPTISTTLSGTEVLVGSSVHDSATLTGATANAGGTVQYTVFSDNECSTKFADAGTVDVDHGQVPNSNGVAFPQAGTYYWQAVYSGDANNVGSRSSCTEEILHVDSPSISITKNPKSQSITVGDTANFTITVKNTGTVTLTNVTVVDLLAPNCAKTIGTLAPGQSTSYDCTLSAVQQSFTNSATATGHPPVGPDVTATDTAPVTVNQLPPPPPPPPPAPKIDLAITKVGTPNPTTVNHNITWTITVVNNGPNNATGVTVADAIPGGTAFVSATSTQGTCTGTAMLNCQIGSLSVGQTVTITLVTTANQTGTIPNTAIVVGNEAETNTANNTATATVNVVGVFKPPVVYCTAVAVSPKQLFVGKTNTLKMRLTQHGKAARGVRVRIKGSTISVTTAPSNAHGLVTRKVTPKKAGIVMFTPIASKRCNAPRVGVIGVFTPPVTG
jgi:uncharacterized repeat protein (TIGR01451 family)